MFSLQQLFRRDRQEDARSSASGRRSSARHASSFPSAADIAVLQVVIALVSHAIALVVDRPQVRAALNSFHAFYARKLQRIGKLKGIRNIQITAVKEWLRDAGPKLAASPRIRPLFSRVSAFEAGTTRRIAIGLALILLGAGVLVHGTGEDKPSLAAHTGTVTSAPSANGLPSIPALGTDELKNFDDSSLTTGLNVPALPGGAATPAATGSSAGSTEMGPALLTLASDGIPAVAQDAYVKAAIATAITNPTCALPWQLLAAIGRVESNHGRFGGALTSANGTTAPKIVGPPLNGTNNNAVISDTDKGILDGDTVFDRAVGPMQFIPGTWAKWGADGNGDHIADPSNLYDASLAAAHYLCAAGGDMRTGDGQTRAVMAYNHSAAYVNKVLALEALYAAGTPGVSVPTAVVLPVTVFASVPPVNPGVPTGLTEMLAPTLPTGGLGLPSLPSAPVTLPVANTPVLPVPSLPVLPTPAPAPAPAPKPTPAPILSLPLPVLPILTPKPIVTPAPTPKPIVTPAPTPKPTPKPIFISIPIPILGITINI